MINEKFKVILFKLWNEINFILYKSSQVNFTKWWFKLQIIGNCLKIYYHRIKQSKISKTESVVGNVFFEFFK